MGERVVASFESVYFSFAPLYLVARLLLYSAHDDYSDLRIVGQFFVSRSLTQSLAYYLASFCVLLY